MLNRQTWWNATSKKNNKVINLKKSETSFFTDQND